MMVQLGEMLQSQSGGEILPTVEESQGSVQNVDRGRPPPRRLPVHLAAQPDRRCAGRRRPVHRRKLRGAARRFSPMPFITIHMVVRADSDIETVADLAGRSFISGGTGTFCQGQVASSLRDAGHRRQRDRARDGAFGRARRAAQQPGRRLCHLLVASHATGAGTGRDPAGAHPSPSPPRNRPRSSPPTPARARSASRPAPMPASTRPSTPWPSRSARLRGEHG